MGIGVSDMLLSSGEAVHIRKGFWQKNITMNFWPEARRVVSGLQDVKSFLVRIRKPYNLLIYEITAFNSNNNIVSINTLYGKEKANVAFVRVRGFTSLLTIGSKTLTEYRTVGHDSYRKSRVPFLMDDELNPINLY